MSLGDQGTKRRRNITKNFNHLSRAHERYTRQTDTRQTDERAILANMNVSSRSLKRRLTQVSVVLSLSFIGYGKCLCLLYCVSSACVILFLRFYLYQPQNELKNVSTILNVAQFLCSVLLVVNSVATYEANE